MVKKDIPLRDNLRCSEVTCKVRAVLLALNGSQTHHSTPPPPVAISLPIGAQPYKGYGDLYHFTLEEMLDYGPSLIAKFASTDAKAIRELRAVIIAYIIHERKRRTGVCARPPAPAVPGGDSAMHHSHGGSPKPANASSTSAGPSAPETDKYAKWGAIN